MIQCPSVNTSWNTHQLPNHLTHTHNYRYSTKGHRYIHEQHWQHLASVSVSDHKLSVSHYALRMTTSTCCKQKPTLVSCSPHLSSPALLSRLLERSTRLGCCCESSGEERRSSVYTAASRLLLLHSPSCTVGGGNSKASGLVLLRANSLVSVQVKLAKNLPQTQLRQREQYS